MTTSGSYTYDPKVTDIGLDAFDRCEIRPSMLTADHMFSLHRSVNSVLIRWANRGVNLWATDLQTIPLTAGQAAYNLPNSTVAMLETYIRNYQMAEPTSLTPAFATTMSSTTVTVTWADHGLSVEDWVQVIIPVAIGGIVLSGFYQVQSVPSTSTFTITAASAATSAASGGAVPVYSTTAADATVSVALTAHGYSAGETHTVKVSTAVGGLTLLGDYTIATITNANNFTFEAASAAGSTDSASENDGEAKLAGQSQTADPTDRLLSPLSRTNYAAIANKGKQGGVTSYFFDRQTPTPTVTLWQVPNDSGPYELRFYRMRQLQTATPAGAETLDVPYRFLEAFTAELAFHLSMKWNKKLSQMLKGEAAEIWMEAAGEDRERVPLTITPDLSSYYR